MAPEYRQTLLQGQARYRMGTGAAVSSSPAPRAVGTGTTSLPEAPLCAPAWGRENRPARSEDLGLREPEAVGVGEEVGGGKRGGLEVAEEQEVEVERQLCLSQLEVACSGWLVSCGSPRHFGCGRGRGWAIAHPRWRAEGIPLSQFPDASPRGVGRGRGAGGWGSGG